MFDQLRHIKHTLVRSCVNPMGFHLSRWLYNAPLTTLYYHFVASAPAPHLTSIYRSNHSPQTFTRELEFLQKNYSIVRAGDVFEFVCGRARLPKNACLLTFDDGQREVYEFAFPILCRLGIPFVFFLTERFVDNQELFYKYKASLIAIHCAEHGESATNDIVWPVLAVAGIPREPTLAQTLQSISYRQCGVLDQIAERLGLDFNGYLTRHRPFVTTQEVLEMLSSGLVEVGAHSIDHPRFTELTTVEQIEQIRSSMASVTTKFGVKEKLFAFPYSDLGVTDETYTTIFREGLIDLAFGTAGMKFDGCARIIQRCWMDEPHPPWKKLGGEYRKALILKSQRSNGISRRFSPGGFQA